MLNDSQTNVVQHILDKTYEQIGGVDIILLATVDGFKIATAGNKKYDETMSEKFSAIASSMIALGGAAGLELSAGKMDANVLRFENLQLLLIAVKASTNDYVLALAAEKKFTLGNLLWAVRECAYNIEQTLV